MEDANNVKRRLWPSEPHADPTTTAPNSAVKHQRASKAKEYGEKRRDAAVRRTTWRRTWWTARWRIRAGRRRGGSCGRRRGRRIPLPAAATIRRRQQHRPPWPKKSLGSWMDGPGPALPLPNPAQAPLPCSARYRTGARALRYIYTA